MPTRTWPILLPMVLMVLAWRPGAGALATATGAPAARQTAGQPAPPAGPPPLSTEQPPLPTIDAARPTLFLIGDSTVKVGTAGQMGWGEALGPFFDLSRLNLVNYARGGRSSRTFLTEGLWIRALSAMRPGDTVVIQFGHNDPGELFETTRPRGSLPGIGDDTREGVVALTHTFEVVHTYGWYLRQYLADVRARGATPILCSLTPRKIWKDGHIVRDEHAAWAHAVASAAQVPFLDLNEIVARKYEALGADKVNDLFGDEHTHTNAAGAQLNAAAVIEGLRGIDSPLVKYLTAQEAPAAPDHDRDHSGRARPPLEARSR
jgi:rhamnogalacturonan acetylesterase